MRCIGLVLDCKEKNGNERIENDILPRQMLEQRTISMDSKGMLNSRVTSDFPVGVIKGVLHDGLVSVETVVTSR